jgi:hypothetical protein
MITATARKLTLPELSYKERNERFDRRQERMRGVWEIMRGNGEGGRAHCRSRRAKVIIKRDRHVGLRAEVDLTAPQRGRAQARRRTAPDHRTHLDLHRSRTTGIFLAPKPLRSAVMARLDH